jgi:hypothetical protein
VKNHLAKLTKLHKSETLKKSRFSRANLVIFAIIFASIGGYLIYSSFAAGTCNINVTTVSNAALVNGINSAQPGQTVCLVSGDYGELHGGSQVNKTSPGVTITAASGATPVLSVNASETPTMPMAWLIFDGVTISGSAISSPGHDLTFKNSHMSGYNQINPGYWGGPNGGNNGCSNCSVPMNNANIVFDNDLFDLSDCPTGSCLNYEGRLSIMQGAGTNAGITVKNSTFRDNCADGIQMSSDFTGITIGPGNVFTNLKQGNCGPHVDSIQPFGGHTVITGNYFHDNETGIAQYDGGLGHNTYSNNVFKNITRDDETILVTGEDGTTVEHNTVYAPDQITFGTSHQGVPATNMIARNNVMPAGFLIQGASVTFAQSDYNICSSGCPGSHSINGQTPLFKGGSTFNQHDDFLITPASPGHLAASDYRDMGISMLNPVCDVNATTSNFKSQLSSITAGKVLCLASGSYGQWNGQDNGGNPFNKAITITAAPGASVTMGILWGPGTMNFTIDGSLMGGTFSTDGGSIHGTYPGNGGGYFYQSDSPRNLTLRNMAFTGSINTDYLVSDTPWPTPFSVNFDHDTFNNINYNGGRITIFGDSNQDSGVVVQNSTLRNGAADGVQVYPAIKILNNEFDNIEEGAFPQYHSDSIQFFSDGTVNQTVIRGNYIHDGADGIAAYDGAGNALIENNVVGSDATNRCLELYHDNAGTGNDPSTVRHNTLINGCTLSLDTKDTAGTGTIIQNNIIPGGIGAGHGSTAGLIDHNMCTGACGGGSETGHISGSASFVSSSPSSHDDFLLKTTSTGHNAASDGTDVGIYALGIVSGSSGSTNPAPTITLTANPTSINSGSSSTLTWSSTNATSCSATSPSGWTSSTATSGTKSVSPTATTTYTISCTGAGGTNTANATITVNLAAGCYQSTTAWDNHTITSQSNSFTFDYDATPQAANINSVVGLSSGPASDYTSLATITRFNDTGTIDARNGSAYAAVNSVTYSAGTSYHFKLTINPANHTYSVTVTPAGGSATTIATNYAFRTEQASVSNLNNWALFQDSGSVGSQTVCSATLNQSSGPKPGDINNDNNVNITDLSLLLSSYNQNTTNCITNNTYTCDLSTPPDNVVNIFDLSILLSHYGT